MNPLDKITSLINLIEIDKITHTEFEGIFDTFLKVIAELKSQVDSKIEDSKSEMGISVKEIAYTLNELELNIKGLINDSQRVSLTQIKELSSRLSSEIDRVERNIPEVKDYSTTVAYLEDLIRSVESKIPTIPPPTPSDTPEQIADKINTLYQKIKPETIIGWDELKKKTTVPENFDVRIGVSKTELKRLTDRVVYLETNPSSSGSGWTVSTPTGALYDQDAGTGGTDFTSVGTAKIVWADGSTFFDGAGCTIIGTSIVMDNLVTNFIRVGV